MKESNKRNKVMIANRHKWIQIGNGYSKCSSCGIVKYHKTKTSAATYTLNNIPVENVGCKKQTDIDTKDDCKHEFVSREYIGQPFGTCMCCGCSVFS